MVDYLPDPTEVTNEAHGAGQNGEHTFGQAPEFSDFTLPMPVQVLQGHR